MIDMDKERMICGESLQQRLPDNTLVLLESRDKSRKHVGLICGFDYVQRNYVVAYDDTYTSVREDSDRLKPLPFSDLGCSADIQCIMKNVGFGFGFIDISIAQVKGVNGEVDKCYVYRGNVLIGTATNLTQLTCAIFGSSSSDQTLDGWLGKLLLDDFEKIKWVD